MYLSSVFSNRIIQIVTVLTMAVILLIIVNSGIQNGKNKAIAETVLNNSQSIAKALEYFYADQNRYPTALEFQNKESSEAMAWYFNKYPIPETIGSTCEKSFEYNRVSPRAYNLYYCLPYATAGAEEGWNQFAQSK